MTATEMETIDETEIFTQALVASMEMGTLTVDQLKRQLEGGLAYVAAQDVDDVDGSLLIALAALDNAIWRVTRPEDAGQAALQWRGCNQTPILVSAHGRRGTVS